MKLLVFISILFVLGNCASITYDTETSLNHDLAIESEPGYITQVHNDSFPVYVFPKGFQNIKSCYILDPNGVKTNGKWSDASKCQLEMDSSNRSNAGDFVVVIGDENKTINRTIPLTFVSGDFSIDAVGLKDSGEQEYFECKLTGFWGTPKVLLLDGATVISSNATVIQSSEDSAVFSFPIQRGTVMKDLQCKINATNVHEFPNIKLSNKSFHLELNYSGKVVRDLTISLAFFVVMFVVMFACYLLKGKDFRKRRDALTNGDAGRNGFPVNHSSSSRQIMDGIVPAGQTNLNGSLHSNGVVPPSIEPSSIPARNGSSTHAQYGATTTEHNNGLINFQNHNRSTHEADDALPRSTSLTSNLVESTSTVDHLTSEDNDLDSSSLSPLEANLISSTEGDVPCPSSVASALEHNKENRLPLLNDDDASKHTNESIELCSINSSNKVLSEVALSNRKN